MTNLKYICRESDPDTVGASVASIVVSSVKAPQQTMDLIMADLRNPAPHVRINAALKIQVLWRHRWEQGLF